MTFITCLSLWHSEIRYLHTTIMRNSESPDRKLWFVNTKQMDRNHTSSNTENGGSQLECPVTLFNKTDFQTRQVKSTIHGW